MSIPEVSRGKKSAFLETFVELGTVLHACRAVGIDPSLPYKWKQTDAEFADAWEDARKQAGETLEREAIRRARDGVAEPVFYRGEQVATVRKYSDTLLIFLLKAWDDKYADRQRLEHVGDGLRVQFSIPRPDEE